MPTPVNPPVIVPQRWVRPLAVEPGHWKQQLPAKYLRIAHKGDVQHYAAAAGHAGVMTVLLEHGADATVADNDGNPALSLARAAGKPPAATYWSHTA